MKQSRCSEREALLQAIEAWSKSRACLENDDDSDLIKHATQALTLHSELVRARTKILVEMNAGIRNPRHNRSLHGIDDMLLRLSAVRTSINSRIEWLGTPRCIRHMLCEADLIETLRSFEEALRISYSARQQTEYLPESVRERLFRLLCLEVSAERLKELTNQAGGLSHGHGGS